MEKLKSCAGMGRRSTPELVSANVSPFLKGSDANRTPEDLTDENQRDWQTGRVRWCKNYKLNGRITDRCEFSSGDVVGAAAGCLKRGTKESTLVAEKCVDLPSLYSVRSVSLSKK